MMKKKINLKNIIDIKKVISLTKVLCKDYFEKLPIFKSKESGQGKFFKICSIIAIVGLAWVSYYIINFLTQTTNPEIFLNAFLLIMAIIIIFQQIIASTNIYYFSKDLEYILPFPIKPIELLLARFNMLISISYFSILMFVLIPLLIYGLLAAESILYYPSMIIVLLTFPIFFGFKGGKGVATSLGVLIMANWQIGLICLVFALVLMVLTRMVSLGSVMVSILFPVLTIFITENYIVDGNYIIFGLIMAVIVIFNHRSNIKRIYNGEEHKIGSKAN